jgi:SH3 domain protein
MAGLTTNNKKPAFLLLAVLFVLTGIDKKNVSADTQYVTDMLYISVRVGKGTGKQVETLRSDAPVEVLEESGRFVKVRTQAGNEGWAASQYISNKIPKSYVIEKLKTEAGQLKSTIKDFNDESENLSELRAENELLKNENSKLSRDVRQLRKMNKRPRPPAMFWWFLAGGSVFAAGVLTSLISKKKKYYLDMFK